MLDEEAAKLDLLEIERKKLNRKEREAMFSKKQNKTLHTYYSSVYVQALSKVEIATRHKTLTPNEICAKLATRIGQKTLFTQTTDRLHFSKCILRLFENKTRHTV